MLEAEGTNRTYRDDQVIFLEGDRGNEMYVIEKGKVRLIKKMYGIIHEIALLEPGDFFGEMALFEDAPRSATAMAQGKVQVLVYGRDTLTEQIKREPALALKMLSTMSQRLRKIDEEVTDIIAKKRLPKEETEKIRRYIYTGIFD